MCSLVRRVHISACFWEKRTSDSMCQRWKRPSRLLWTKSAKTSLCDGMGGISAHGMGDVHICEGMQYECTIVAEADVGILEKRMLPSRWWLFLGTSCLFQQDSDRPHSAQVTKAWLHRQRMRLFDWPACSPDLSPIENVWHIMKRRIRQRRQWTVAQLKPCIQQEFANNPLAKLQQLIS